MTTSKVPSGPLGAVLCDLDNVIRFYDTSHLAELERAAGVAEGATAKVAYAPEIDLPLLLGEITQQQWVESIVLGLAGQVPEVQARQLGTALAEAPFWADDVVVGLLRRVRSHMPLVLVTNATLELENDLASLGLADLAEHVVSSARVGVAKPDRRIYEIAAERAGVAIDQCLLPHVGRHRHRRRTPPARLPHRRTGSARWLHEYRRAQEGPPGPLSRLALRCRSRICDVYRRSA